LRARGPIKIDTVNVFIIYRFPLLCITYRHTLGE